jgi:hypothetical protein
LRRGLLLSVVLCAVAAAAAIDLVFARLAEQAAAIRSASYLADYRYQEKDGSGRLLRDDRCRRRDTRDRWDKTRTEYLSMSCFGQEVTGRRRDAQQRWLRFQSEVQQRSRMPFLFETRDEYRYSDSGTRTWRGREVVVVGFEPRRRDSRYVRGRAFTNPASGDIVRVEFVPLGLPWVVREVSMALDYAPQGGFALPLRFEMDIMVKVKVLVTLAERRIHIEDTYSDYRFNADVPGGRDD